MKNSALKNVLVFSLLFLISTYSQAQYGWISQNSGTTTHLHGVSFINANIGTAVGDAGIILKTTNGGSNWNITTFGSGSLYKLCFLNLDTGTIVGAFGSILFTTNGGSSWTIKPSGTSSNLKKIRFIKTNTGFFTTGFIVGVNGVILKTTNSGYNWYSQNSMTDHYLYGIYFTDINNGYAVGQVGYQSGQSTILKTTNGGITWQNISPNINKTLTGVCFINPNTGVVVGGSGYYTNGVILKSTDGGINWQTVFTASSAFQAISYPENNIMTAVGNNGLIVRSTDAGSTWFVQNTPSTTLLKDVSFINDNTGWVVGHNGVILKTLSSPPQTPMLLSPPDSSLVTTTPLLDWNDVSSATTYRLQVSEVANFMTTVIDQVSLTQSQYQVPTGILSANVKYYWRARARNAGGWSPWASAWNFTTSLIGVNVIAGEIPTSYYLYPNFPNPFNPSTTIKFDVPKSSCIKIIVFNSIGKTISELVNEKLNAGRYEVNWIPTNISSGIYFYKLETEEFSDVKKMLYIK